VTLTITGVSGLGDIHPGDDLAGKLEAVLAPIGLESNDILVVTHKVVSKAEGSVVAVKDDQSYRRLIEEEAVAIIRRRGDLVITETKHGFVCANAGVDRSNVAEGWAVLLPASPDASARLIRTRLMRAFGVELAVIISDTFGRAWRRGLTDVAIGVAGIMPILDLRGSTDMYGRELDVTEVAVADEIAAAADLVMGKASGIAAAIVRGAEYQPGNGSIKELIRPPAEDMFR
jgi:coenzyme F420-0:L-glutamate ligase/coenzyme F420-1:gamma-L-glutamate ligase